MANTPKPVDWPVVARGLAKRFGKSAIEPSVAAFLKDTEVRRVLVACSGGADSVCMLCLQVEWARSFGLTLHVAHYNHAWRGSDSDDDAAFVASLADAFGLPYTEGRRAPNEAVFTETTARTLRLDFLRQVATEHACEAIAFGHQLDDVLETQLQRLARGAGSNGLAAPRPVTRFESYPTHLRPLLHLRAGDIRMSLNAKSIPWREDLSNADVRIARNALRHEIIPDLTLALGRDAAQGAARSRRLLEEDAAALDALARARFPEAYAGVGSLDRAALRSAPQALVRRALAEWIHQNGLIGSASAPAMDLLLETVLSARLRFRMSVGCDYVVLNEHTVTVERGVADTPEGELRATAFQSGESVLLSTGALIESECVELDAVTRERIQSGCIDPACEAYLRDSGESSWEVRPWQPGDRFCPLGAPGRKKLKDWFIDRHIPGRERKRLPLVIHPGGEVVWVPGFPPAESCKIKPSSKQALRLTYQPSHPL
jgi:tRNA(Ile)-lysidine synthase